METSVVNPTYWWPLLDLIGSIQKNHNLLVEVVNNSCVTSNNGHVSHILSQANEENLSKLGQGPNTPKSNLVTYDVDFHRTFFIDLRYIPSGGVANFGNNVR